MCGGTHQTSDETRGERQPCTDENVATHKSLKPMNSEEESPLDLPEYALRGHQPPRDSHPDCVACGKDRNDLATWATKLELELITMKATLEEFQKSIIQSIEEAVNGISATSQNDNAGGALDGILNRQDQILSQLESMETKFNQLQLQVRLITPRAKPSRSR